MVLVRALAILLAVFSASTVRATETDERRGRFNELAQRYAATTDPAASEELLAGLLALVDREVVDSLQAGGPFASAAFIQERLDIFGDDWGGASFFVVQPEGRDALTLLLVTLTRAEPRGAFLAYGRAGGDISRLAASVHDGDLALHPWPRGGAGAAQVLVSWVGAPTGRGSRAVLLELWRLGAAARVSRVWSSDQAFPEGLWALDFGVARGQVSVRRELRYPGWTPGCASQTEEEDVYGQPRVDGPVTLVRRRVRNAWHRELHAAVARFFAALGAGDSSSLAELVPDRSVRARVPRALELEPACDQPDADAPMSVIVAATTRGPEPPPRPWALLWRRTPRGWRLAAADAVLE